MQVSSFEQIGALVPKLLLESWGVYGTSFKDVPGMLTCYFSLQPDQTTCDNELLELFYKRKLSAQIVHTPFFAAYVTYLLQGVDHSRGSRVDEVIGDLHEAGHTLEAASIRSSLENTHPSLRTLDTALGSFLRWITDR